MRPIIFALPAAVLGLMAAAPPSTTSAPAVLKSQPGPVTRTVALQGPGGREMGSVFLAEGPKGVLVTVDAHGLTPGWHGMHFHEKGDCSDAAFKNSGGHMNHQPKLSHGLLAAGGPDFGDLPNLWVGADGSGRAQAFSTAVTLGAGRGRAALLDADGSALVIHAGPDDQQTQPIGGAGARMACAAIGPSGLIKVG